MREAGTRHVVLPKGSFVLVYMISSERGRSTGRRAGAPRRPGELRGSGKSCANTLQDSKRQVSFREEVHRAITPLLVAGQMTRVVTVVCAHNSVTPISVSVFRVLIDTTRPRAQETRLASMYQTASQGPVHPKTQKQALSLTHPAKRDRDDRVSMDERIHIYIYEIVPLVCGVCLCGPHCGAELDHTPQNRQNRPDVTNTKNVYYSRLRPLCVILR